MQFRRPDIVLWLVLLSVVLSGCTLVTPQRHRETQRQLHDQQQRWSAAPPAAYRYTLQVFCFCAIRIDDGVTIEVHNGTSIILPVSTEALSVEQQQALEQWDTIEDLFALIRTAIGDDYDGIAVDYDPELGYPTRISLDWESEGADDELNMVIKEFSILP